MSALRSLVPTQPSSIPLDGRAARHVARALSSAVILATLFGCNPAPSAESSTKGDASALPEAPAEAKRKPAADSPLFPALRAYGDDVSKGFASIPEERRVQLARIAAYVSEKRAKGEMAKITFICTHNSRRSHMSQLWAAAAAAYYGVDRVETFSGGTEATAFNPRAVAALQRAGFEIDGGADAAVEGANPKYAVRLAADGPAHEAFSKKYADAPNPSKHFAAVMTCSQADKACPTVFGAELRVGLPYEDPKVSDGTPEEAKTYDERARQIATEMFYVFSQVAS
jgi:arsenate reductase